MPATSEHNVGGMMCGVSRPASRHSAPHDVGQHGIARGVDERFGLHVAQAFDVVDHHAAHQAGLGSASASTSRVKNRTSTPAAVTNSSSTSL